MNEILDFAGTIRDAGWVYLCALLAFATGLFLFDRRASARPAEHADTETERRAA